MNINLRHITGSIPASIKNLYEDSFPSKERRPWCKQVSLHSTAVLQLDEILLNDVFAGFVFYWHLSSFTFIEHFSIDPSLRGAGIGAQVIQSFIKKFDRIVLETEKEEMSEYGARRIEFYKRNGFELFAEEYKQPPYEQGNAFIPMNLMACNIETSNEGFEKIRREIYKTVYQLGEDDAT